MTGSMLTAIPAKAEASIDALYANAYNFTVKATTLKTQKSINEAREKISLLPNSIGWAIGEFSKQVDTVQQPIFEKAYSAIVNAQNTPTQANINTAKASIDPDMPAFYKNSYSSAVDVIQQSLMKKAVDAYNKALESKLQVDIDASNKLFEDIKTSTDKSIVAWVDIVQNLGDIKELNDGGTHEANYIISSVTGSFGSADSSKATTIKGNIFINGTNGKSITLKNLNITGTLLINFGAGDVTLDNVIVDGVAVNNVGSHSLHVKGSSKVTSLTVQDSNDDARVVVEENATISKATVFSGALLEVAAGATNIKPFDDVTIAPKSTPAATNSVNLKGTFETVNITTPATVNLGSTTKINNNVHINAAAELAVAQGASVAKVNVSTKTSNEKVVLSGNLNNVDIMSSSTVEVKSGTVNISSSTNAEVKVTTSGDAIVNKGAGTGNVVVTPTPGTPPVTPPSNSGGSTTPEEPSNPTSPTVKEVVITPENFRDEIVGNGEIIKITLPDNVERTVTVYGNSPKLIIDAPNANIVLARSAKINQVIIKDIAKHSLYIKDSSVDILDVEDKNNDAHIVTVGSSTVGTANINSGAIIESESSMKNAFNTFTINNSSSSVKLSGNLGNANVTLQAAAEVSFEGNLNAVTVSDKVDKVSIKENSTVGTLNVGTDKNVINIVDASGNPTADLDKIVEIVGKLVTESNLSLDKYKNTDRTATIAENKNILATKFISELTPYLGEDIQPTQVLEANARETLKILKSYNTKFLGLNELEFLSSKHQLRYAKSFSSMIRSYKKQNTPLTYDMVQKVIHETYGSIRPLIESAKFKGHFEGETPTNEILISKDSEYVNGYIDITDKLIDFDSPLSSITSYNLMGVGSMNPPNFDFIQDGRFKVETNSSGQQRILMKKQSSTEDIVANLFITVKSMGASSTTSINFKIAFEKDLGNTPITVPQISITDTSVGDLSSRQVRVTLKADKVAKGYSVVVPKDASAPTAAQVKENKDANNNYVPSYGFTLQPNVEFIASYILASDDTEYDIYYVLEDSMGNLQSTPTKVTVKTPKFVNTAKDILAFYISNNSCSASIDKSSRKITFSVSSGTDITKLTPIFKISSGATITPNDNTVTNFTKLVEYTVTAGDGSTEKWTVECIGITNP